MTHAAEQGRGSWGSKLAFIFAASGSAIGLGSLWRFPIMVGRHGGAVYVIAYFLAVFFIGFTVMLAEIAIGRHTQRNVVGAFATIRPHTPWKLAGYVGVVTGIVILSYYAVVAGWAFGYFYKTLLGRFRGATWAVSEAAFTRFAANPWEVLACFLVIMAVTTYIISKGIQSGIERFSKIFMPLLFALIIYLGIRALMLPGAGRGVAFYLQPDWTRLDFKLVFFAIGQAFYSLSLGMGIMVTYGSYIPKRENLVSSAGWVCFSTSVVAFLAGIIIFPTLFAVPGLDPQQFSPGTGLMFQVFPLIIAQIPGGYVFGVFFFLLLLIAAVTSTISLLEVPTAFLVDEHKWTRAKAAWLIGGAACLLGVPSALSVGASPLLTRWNFMGVADLLFGNIILAVGALAICVFLVYAWGLKKALAEIGEGAGRFRLRRLWIFDIRVLAPLAIILVLIFIREIAK